MSSTIEKHMWHFLAGYKLIFAIGFIALNTCLFTKRVPRMLFLLVLILCGFYLISDVIKPERSGVYTWRFAMEFSLVYFATCVGLRSYRFMTMFQKVMLMQVCLYFIFYLFTWYVKLNQLVHGETPDTILLFDFYLPVETALLLIASAIFFKSWYIAVALTGMFLFFLLVHLTEIFNREAMLFDGSSIVTQNMLITICYLFLLYNYFSHNALTWKQEPDIWLLAGLLIYSACIIPYASMMDQLQTAGYNKIHLPDKNTNAFLYYFIVGALANVRYGCMTLTFYLLCRYQTKKAGT